MIARFLEDTSKKDTNFYFDELMDGDEKYYLSCISESLKKIFSEIFSEDIMGNEICMIYNEPESECPMLITNPAPLRIRLHLKTTSYWDQLIYQLAHELCHYAIRENNKNRSGKLKRFEEILCESFSLYMLTVVAERWQECELSEINLLYDKQLISYFICEYAKGKGHNIKSEMTIEEYIMENNNSENDRESHIAETNYTLELFREHPDKITEIIQYTSYIKSDKSLLIDFDLWSSNTVNKSFVKDLSVIQPQII